MQVRISPLLSVCPRVVNIPLTKKIPSLGDCCVYKILCLHVIPMQAKCSFNPKNKSVKLIFLLLCRESMMLILTPFHENGCTEWISLLSENPSAVGLCSWLSSDLHCARGWDKFYIKFSWICIFAFYTLRNKSVLIVVQKKKIISSFGEILFALFASQILQNSRCPCLRRSLSWLIFLLGSLKQTLVCADPVI